MNIDSLISKIDEKIAVLDTEESKLKDDAVQEENSDTDKNVKGVAENG